MTILLVLIVILVAYVLFYLQYSRDQKKKENNQPQSHTERAISMTPQEYQRTCKRCGTVWHSLVEREKTIEANNGQFAQFCSAVGAAERGTRVSMDLIQQDEKNELTRLRKCPKCLSAAYDEKIVV